MHKKIILLLLVMITSTISHGMKLTQNNREALSHFTKHLCAAHNYNPHSLKNDIRSLSDTNTLFHDYYAQETTAQEIIKRCAYYHYSHASANLNYYANDKNFAEYLQCRTVEKKIKYFINIAKDEKLKFSQDDLKETWYLTLTSNRNDGQCHTYKKDISLLGIALYYNNFKAANIILDHVQQLDFYYGDLYELCSIHTEGLRAIAQKIISKKAPTIDNTDKEHGYSKLLDAVKSLKEEFTRFLLENGIHPYAKPTQTRDVFYDVKYTYINNSMREMHVPRVWFQKMVTEIEKKRAPLKYLLLKHYTPDGHTIFPQELALLITSDSFKITLLQIDQSVEK